MNKGNIGLIGIGVMGENLSLNMESKGFTVAVFDIDQKKVDNFVNGRAKGKKIIGAHSVKELIDALEKPRKVMMMVQAGKTVDTVIDELIPLMENGDIIIDGGNSHFPDTTRRTKYLESKGYETLNILYPSREQNLEDLSDFVHGKIMRPTIQSSSSPRR